ncbi:DUF4383 domain-containing protein [Romeria aff. gracilis LEGE 07310]|uniref:DUF4383 domain-containing protein n=1 Tax=Vasconcelosia minhoensis LEGE 07310 TaxID=915328 RepID=A0A8J7AIZ8_9CYAN|nr:DUF4383 domain-containing protein [Romeria gracilis]MBE9079961.1 DUF4383 domain-containing protein [Romeria aff. gracilis LEGE 07310]
MAVRSFALTVGIVYTIVGILGFIPSLVEPATSAPHLLAEVDQGGLAGYGYLFGLFPINTYHNTVHLIVGASGVVAYLTEGSSRIFAGTLAVFYGLLGVMGLIPNLNTTLGLIPLYGNDVWLHLGTAAISAYFGFAKGWRSVPPQANEEYGAPSN